MGQSRDKDGGWAWVVLVSCSLCVLVTSGLAILAGMFQKVFLDHFGGDVVLISWITAMFSSIMQLAGPITGLICTVSGCRASIMAGASLLTIGLYSSSFCKNAYALLVTFGISSGLGMGLIYSAAIVRVNLSFERYRPVASGTVLACGGLGITLGPVLCRYLLDAMGWAWTLMVLSALSAQLVVAGALLYPVQTLQSSGLGWCRARFRHCIKTRKRTPASRNQADNEHSPNDQQQQQQFPLASKSPILSTGDSDSAGQHHCAQNSHSTHNNPPQTAANRTADAASTSETSGESTRLILKEVSVTAAQEGDKQNSDDDLHRRSLPRSIPAAASETDREFTEIKKEEEEEEDEEGEEEEAKRPFLSRNFQRSDSHGNEDDATVFPSGCEEEEAGALPKPVDSPQCCAEVGTASPRSVRNSEPRLLSTSAQSLNSTSGGGGGTAPSTNCSEGQQQQRHCNSDTNLTVFLPSPTKEEINALNHSSPATTTTKTTEMTSTWAKLLVVLKSPAVLLICLQLFLANAALGIVLVHYVEFCLQSGTDFATVSTAFSVNGMTLTVARFLMGALAQDPNVDILAVFVGLALVTSAVYVTMPVVAVTGNLQIVMMGALGMYCGGSYAMLTEITIHCTGVDTLGFAFGLEMTLAGLGFLVAPPIAGWLVVLTRSYSNAIFLAGFLNLVAAFVAMAISIARPVWKPRDPLDAENNYVITPDENEAT